MKKFFNILRNCIFAVMFLSAIQTNAQVTILTSDFAGIAPAANLPWIKTSVLDSHLTFTGWDFGAGTKRGTTDNSWNGTQIDNTFAVSIIASNPRNTLQESMTENQYISFKISPTAGYKLDLNLSTVTFDVALLYSNNAPKKYSVFSSINGFNAGNEIYLCPGINEWNSTTNQTITFNFPATGYDNITSEVEIRVYLHEASYAYHTTTIASWTMSGLVSPNTATSLSTTNNNLDGFISYPNPTIDDLSLNFGSVLKNANISILDLQGRNVFSRTITNTQKDNIDVSGLKSGVYFIKVTQGDQVINSKFVKK